MNVSNLPVCPYIEIVNSKNCDIKINIKYVTRFGEIHHLLTVMSIPYNGNWCEIKDGDWF